MKTAFLIKLDFRGLTEPEPIYITTAQRSLDYLGNTYSAGFARFDGSVSEKAELSTDTYEIELGAVNQLLIGAFASKKYHNRQCLIRKATLNAQNQVVSVETFFDGDMGAYSFKSTVNGATITLTMVSSAGKFNSVNSVNLGALFSEYINDNQAIYWGTQKGGTVNNGGGRPGRGNGRGAGRG